LRIGKIFKKSGDFLIDMGIFNNLFKSVLKNREPEQLDCEVKLPDLNDWFENKLRDNFESTKDVISDHLKQIEKMSQQTETRLEQLRNAKLRNSNIPARAKQILRGNLDAYIHKVSTFISEISYPEEIDFKSVISFSEKMQKKIEELGKSTTKAYYVLQEFHANESHKVAITIKMIEKIIKNIITDMGVVDVTKMENLRKDIHHVENLEKNIEEKRSLISAKEKEKLDYKKKNTGLKNGIEEIESSDEYKSYKELKNRKDDLNKDFTSKKLEFVNDFVSKPLKKFERSAFDNVDWIKKYNSDPANALISDTGFVIQDILRSLKNSMENDRLDFKNKEKMLKNIDDLIGGKISKYQSSLIDLKDSLEKSENTLLESKVKSTISQKAVLINENIEKIKIIDKELSAMKESMEKIDIKSQEESLAKSISDFFGINLSII